MCTPIIHLDLPKLHLARSVGLEGFRYLGLRREKLIDR